MTKFVVLAVLLLAACAPAPRSVLAEVTPRRTRTALPEPTATVDYRATMQVTLDAAINSAAAARRAELDAQQRAIYAEQTAQAANVRALELTVTLGAQEIQRAAVNATISSVGATRQADNYRQWSAQATATAQAPALMLMAAKATNDANTLQIRSVLASLTMFTTALIVLLLIVYVLVGLRKPAEDEPEEAEPVDTYPGGLSLSVFDGIASLDQLREMARRVLAGAPLTHNVFTPAENLLSEGHFASVQYILVKYGLAVWDDATHKGGITLTEAGWAWVRALANTPPPGGDATTTRNSAQYQSIDSLPAGAGEELR